MNLADEDVLQIIAATDNMPPALLRSSRIALSPASPAIVGGERLNRERLQILKCTSDVKHWCENHIICS